MLVVYIALAVVITYMVVRWRFRRMKIKDLESRYVFITGCDSGFGNLIAKKLDSLGFNVFAGCLTEKGGDELRKVTSRRLTVLQLDVTNASNIKQCLEKVKTLIPPEKGLWALINNAGVFGPTGVLEWLSLKDYENVMRVNIFGMVEVTRLFLPLIRQAKGRIVNTTSISGRLAVGSAPYVTSKFAAEGYSDTLRREVYRMGVSVHIVEPGGFRTNIVTKEMMYKSMKDKFYSLSKETRDFYGEAFLNECLTKSDMTFNLALSPRLHQVVDAYTDAVTSKFPKCRYLVGYDANYVYRLLWNMPEWLSDFLLGMAWWPKPVAMRSQRWKSKNIK